MRTINAYRNLGSQSMTLASTSVVSTTLFGSQTQTIRLVSNQLTKYLFLESAAATVSSVTVFTNGANLPANTIEYTAVTPGMRIAAMTTSTAADLTVTELG